MVPLITDFDWLLTYLQLTSTSQSLRYSERDIRKTTGMCPKGDDPLTTGQSDRVLMLRTTAQGGSLDGEVLFTFNGESASLSADAQQVGDQECARALMSMPNIGSVSCERGAVNERGGADYIISLLR